MGKRCRDCSEKKSLDEFYRHPKKADGRMGLCKTCHKSRMRKRYREKMRDPEWRENERARSRKKFRKHGHRWPGPSPRQRAANTAVSNAVRDGRLIPANECEECGHDFSEFRREAHHPDYDKPLDVDWLCALCHGKRHRLDQSEAA